MSVGTTMEKLAKKKSLIYREGSMSDKQIKKLKSLYPSAVNRQVKLPWPLVKTAVQISILLYVLIVGIIVLT